MQSEILQTGIYFAVKQILYSIIKNTVLADFQLLTIFNEI